MLLRTCHALLTRLLIKLPIKDPRQWSQTMTGGKEKKVANLITTS